MLFPSRSFVYVRFISVGDKQGCELKHKLLCVKDM